MRNTFERIGQSERAWDTRYFDQKIKAACTECNSGWMARLEHGVEQLITPMIRGEHIGIDRDGRAVISAWALKSAMVVEYAEKPDKRYFTQSERSLIMHNFVPSGTGIRIWIGRYQGSFNGAIGSASFFLVPRTDGVTDSAHTLTLAVGQFVIQVFAERLTAHHSEVLNVREGPWQKTLIPMWPPRPATDEVALIWPPPLALTADTFAALGRPLRRLGFVKPPA